MRKYTPLILMLIVSIGAIAYGCARADETAKPAAETKSPETRPTTTTAPATEPAEERLDVYKGFLESAAPDAVRAYVAFRAAQIARERGESDLEDTYLTQCLKLNPLNLDALRTRLEHLTQDGKPEERVDVLLSMLKSNPVQPGATYRLAREIADAGLPQEAL